MSVFFTASYPPRHYHYHPFDSSVDYYHQLAAEHERRAQAARALARRQRERELEDFYQFQSMLSHHHHRHNHHQRRWAPYRYTVHRILPREPSPEQVRRDEQEQKIDAWLERRRRKEAVERIFGSLFLGNNNEAIESTQEGDTQPAPESNASGNDTEFVEKLWNALGSGRSDEEKERILWELNLPLPQHQPTSTPTTTTPDVKGKAKEVSVADPEEVVHIPVIEVWEPASAPVASTSASGTEETPVVDKEVSPLGGARSRSASVSSSSSIVELGGEKKVRRPSSVVVEEVVDEDT